MKIVDTKRDSLRPDLAGSVRINRTGRRTYTREYKLEVVRQCSASSMSVAAVAMTHGINANLVRRWIVGHEQSLLGPVPKGEATLLPVTMDAARVPVKGCAGGAATKRKGPDVAAIEIELYGARIHLHGGVDVQALRDVLAVLAQR